MISSEEGLSEKRIYIVNNIELCVFINQGEYWNLLISVNHPKKVRRKTAGCADEIENLGIRGLALKG
jgi:hypothetical protein